MQSHHYMIHKTCPHWQEVKVHSQRWHKFHNSMLCNTCSFLWEDLREVNYQVWWLWLTLVSNTFNTRRRKPYYEVEAEAGGTLFLVLTIRSSYSMPEKPEKPARKEWLIVSCLIKVAALYLSLSPSPRYTHTFSWTILQANAFCPKKGACANGVMAAMAPIQVLPFWNSHLACNFSNPVTSWHPLCFWTHPFLGLHKEIKSTSGSRNWVSKWASRAGLSD